MCVKIEIEGEKFPLRKGLGVLTVNLEPALLWQGVGFDHGDVCLGAGGRE